ncbi:ATP-binding protein [Streptomyces phaeoluteigriseus]|uniref:ATP-binding protein n=1 Tax=Streptomyces phaeoluteigriseus TaxID=114686 RepID=A0ABY4ZB25_9ACTN|nr:ATP-binding protein [Streptomyces phaeoluteigriseus]USQ86229.1 ATP-binding protein [Streptomyces phaeoluteigriseus]
MTTIAAPPVTQRHAVTLPCGRRAPAVARHIAERWLNTADRPDRVADAVLIVSELVTNAVRHTHESCLLTLTVRGGQLDIAVADHSEELPDLHAWASAGEHGGFGMEIVRRLGAQVRVVPALGGKTVHVLLWLDTG